MDGFTNLEQEHIVDAIVGWRSWKIGYTYTETDGEQIVYGEPRLVSIAINPDGIDQTPWQPGKRAEAVHWGEANHKPSEVPHPSCTCGYWAFKERSELSGQYGTNPYCFGQVSLWGRIIQGQRGYRAQYAYPLGVQVSEVVRDLWNELLGDGRNIVTEISKTYMVEVETFEAISF